jgi:cytoplasmic iron level regulating protein YaaA (DUF328/UPF0246 family)
MLTLLSPAKTLDLSPGPKGLRPTQPRFKRDFTTLLERCKQLDRDDLRALMGLSPALTELNLQRFRDMSPRFTRANSKPALLAFKGDVYRGLDAASLSPKDIRWAQDHLRIISGLYGLLRPLDLMQPYRLEMGTRLATARGDTLYDFWGTRLADALNAEHRRRKLPAILNLASNEYIKAIPQDALEAPLVTAQFKEYRKGALKTIAFSAKKARGLMARFIVDNRIDHPDHLMAFAAAGYSFAPDLSTPSLLLFAREQQAA